LFGIEEKTAAGGSRWLTGWMANKINEMQVIRYRPGPFYGIRQKLHPGTMTRFLLVLLMLFTAAATAIYFWPHPKAVAELLPAKKVSAKPPEAEKARLRLHAKGAAGYARRNGFSPRVGFLVDMRQHSGRNRFFIYDLQADTVLASGLVAHGSCNMGWLTEASFGNEPGCGCTSVGRYKVGYPYKGRFGTAYKLYGLDSSNSNAFRRFVVLHAYDCIPDVEIYPRNICNSLGCPMVSYQFLETTSRYIRKEKRPILMWVYN
jgi:hypothetical protein